LSRLSVLASQPKLALGALLTLLLAAAAVVGSGADFTANSANPENTFSAGTLAMENSKKNAAILTASNMKPGGAAASGTVDIKNSGSLAGTFELVRATPVDTDNTNPLSGKLNITVVDCGVWSGETAPACDDTDNATKYNGGTLAQMSSPVALGTFAPDAKRRYEFKVGLDGSAGNDYQGDSSTVRFEFNAKQS
jgi:spore coat-associated protein N